VQALDRNTDECVVRGKLADGKVELDGAIRVIAGSHASAARNHLPKRAPVGLAESKDVDTTTLVSVAPGDDVIAGVITSGLEKTFGEAQRKACWDAPDHADDGPLEITNTHACALAAAMPDSRANKLVRV